MLIERDSFSLAVSLSFLSIQPVWLSLEFEGKADAGGQLYLAQSLFLYFFMYLFIHSFFHFFIIYRVLPFAGHCVLRDRGIRKTELELRKTRTLYNLGDGKTL